jgi:histidine triad (HIT) family protein
VMRFEPLNPVTPGHLLFVPYEHVERGDKYAGLAVGRAVAIAHDYGQVFDHFNIIQSNGGHATQTVPHLHVHLVPRRENDGLHLPWTGQHA